MVGVQVRAVIVAPTSSRAHDGPRSWVNQPLTAWAWLGSPTSTTNGLPAPPSGTT